MKKNYLFTFAIAFVFLFGIQSNVAAQAPSQSNAVMIQAFHWDSNAETSWDKLYQISGDLSGNFDVVWLPPSAFSSGGTGYMPKQLSNQNSAWGTANSLKRLISALKANNSRPMADIVVNHRDGMTSWMDFYTDNFGSYGTFTFGREHICSNDEAQYSSAVPANQKPTGANDTGENFAGTRDLDHTNSYVQDATKAYMKWMKNEMQYDGWRYDMVKGFSGSYINIYNAAGGAYLSVGEYWDGNYDLVMGWVNATGKTSTAFDFPMKYAALNNGLAGNNYGAMAWSDGSKNRPAGLIHSAASNRYAVTFVDNHDTYRDGSKFTGDILKANAYILSSPGIPCVFYPHWRDYKTEINAMIKARKSVGLHNESDVEVQNTSGFYKAYSKGTCGEMLTFIGGSEGSWNAPTAGGWSKACGGNGWAMYTKLTSQSCLNEFQAKLDNGINPSGGGGGEIGTLTIKVKVPASWTSVKIWAWDASNNSTNYTGGKWPGVDMKSEGDNVFSYTINNVTASEVGVVVNNGGTTPTEQTVDLFTTGNVCWKLGDAPVITTNPKKYEATVSEDCFGGTGVISPKTVNLQIYPNPTAEKLYINSDEDVKEIEIYSITAEKVMQLEGNINQVDVSKLQSGIYTIKARTETNNLVSLRFIKK